MAFWNAVTGFGGGGRRNADEASFNLPFDAEEKRRRMEAEFAAAGMAMPQPTEGPSRQYAGPLEPDRGGSIPTMDFRTGGDAGGYTPWTPEEAQAQIGPDGQFIGGTPPPMAESLPPDLVAQIEARRPAMGEPVLPPPQGDTSTAPGTLGGAVGMGQPVGGAVGLGGGYGMGSAAGGATSALRGMFGMGGGGGGRGWFGGGRGQAQTSALQSTSGYGAKAGQPYGMAPQAGPGYSQLGGVGAGYGRQR